MTFNFDTPAFDSGTNLLPLFRTALQSAQQALKERFLGGAPAEELVRGRARVVDDLLIRVWHKLVTPSGGDEDIALVAVGGYGRGELHPGSDIDLLILLRNGDHARYQDRLEQFLVFLWDIGLEVGHSVRSLQECVDEASRDITIATNLMESRPLAGSPSLFEAMRAATGPQRIWPSRRFFEAKWQEQIARHHKYHDTAYNLEPNVKEGPGGLRDIQMIGWVAKRHFGATTLHDLVGHGFLTESEYQELIAGQNFLWRVRFALHTLAGRREDRLLFDHQKTVAQQFGFQDEEHKLAVEQLMKEYYRTIMELSRLNEMLLQLFQEAILYADSETVIVPINNRFQARNNFIEARYDGVFRRYPFALLEVFLILQQHPELKGVRAATIRLIRDHRHLIDEKFRNDLRNRTLFMEIMRQPRGVTHELRRMNRYGVLAAYVSIFGNIVGQMQYDLFHVYTVDEHTLMVVRNLRRFSVPEFAQEFPHCSELAQRIPKPEILWLGGFFHDIAKGRGGDHSELGAQDAMTFCLHHGMSPYDARFVAWLVKHHLIMSSTAQRKDISDPQVIAEFAAKVGDQAHLDYLYLLTVADIRGTNPALWNGWKDALLMDLYTATKRALRRGLEHIIDHAERVDEIKQQALAILKQHAPDETVIEKLWRDLGDDYFLRHSADEIAWHTQTLIHCSPADLPLVLVRQQTPRGGTEIFIYARDEDHLFATTTRTLDQLGLTIVDARIITANSGFTLDTYIVLEASGEAITNAYRIQEILVSLKQYLVHPGESQPPISRRAPRQLKYFPTPTEIHFSNDERNHRTAMELITSDRPGLLSRVGQAFMECGARLQNAKIATLGARAEDVFFITDKNNRPLCTEEQFDCLRKTIARHLERQQ
ncbi:MAG: [protein-PII] uridylyltransferase [Pseudomonadota bacterium]